MELFIRYVYIPIILLPDLLNIKISRIISGTRSVSNCLYALGSLLNKSLDILDNYKLNVLRMIKLLKVTLCLYST